MEHPLYCRNEELVDYEFPMIAEAAEAEFAKREQEMADKMAVLAEREARLKELQKSHKNAAICLDITQRLEGKRLAAVDPAAEEQDRIKVREQESEGE